MIHQAAELRVTPHEPDPRKPSRAGIVQEQLIPTGDIGINQLPLPTQAPENGGRCQSQRIEDEPRRNEDFEQGVSNHGSDSLWWANEPPAEHGCCPRPSRRSKIGATAG
jgi:hypothetical protein